MSGFGFPQKYPNTKNGRSALSKTLMGNGNNANMRGINEEPSLLNSLKTTASGAAAAVGKLFNPAAAAAAAGPRSVFETQMAEMNAENNMQRAAAAAAPGGGGGGALIGNNNAFMQNAGPAIPYNPLEEAAAAAGGGGDGGGVPGNYAGAYGLNSLIAGTDPKRSHIMRRAMLKKNYPTGTAGGKVGILYNPNKGSTGGGRRRKSRKSNRKASRKSRNRSRK